jgi:hypothetical protein
MAIANYDAIDVFQMTGGIDTVASGIFLTKDKCRDSQNVDYFPIGGFSKRNGLDALNDAAVEAGVGCTGLYMARYSTAGGTNLAYLVAGAKLWSMSAALAGTWTDATGSLTITDNDNLFWSFAMLNDICVAGNGSDASLQINSSGSASALSGGSLPFTTFLVPLEARGYMFYLVPTVGGTVQYDRAYFSDINDPATVGANNFINVAKGQGGGIRGGVEYKTFVFIFKRHGIYQLTYQPTRVNSSGTAFPWTEFPNPVIPGVGTQSPRSIVKFTTPSTHVTPGQEYVFFIDQFGIPRIFDGSTTISLSSKIHSSRDTTILSMKDMDRSRLPYAHAVNYPEKNRIIFHMSRLNSQEDTAWVLDYSLGFAIGRYKYAFPFNCSALFEKADGKFKPYFGSYAGKVYESDTGTTDDGQPIDDYLETPDYYSKSPLLRNKWHFADLRGQNGDTTENTRISFYLNGEDTPTDIKTISLADEQTEWGAGMIWGQSSWAKAGIVNRSLEVNQESKTLRLRIESEDKTNDSLVIDGFFLAAETLGTSQI